MQMVPLPTTAEDLVKFTVLVSRVMDMRLTFSTALFLLIVIPLKMLE
jgi:hypothetical protein